MSGAGRADGALLGKVTVEGEPLLWDPVPIAVLCNGTMVHTTLTDPKGNFTITSAAVPNSLSVQADAKRQMETHLEGCNVEASLAGFRSNTITITVRHLRDDPDLGTITLQRKAAAAGTAISVTTASAPANALQNWQKAGAALQEQKPERAQRDLEKAVEIYPGFASAWYELGKLQLASSVPDARASFTKSVAADHQFVPPYEQLAALAVQDGNWKDALIATNKVLTLNPAGNMRTWYFNGLANFQLGRTAAAEASVKKSLAMDPLHNLQNTEQLLAVILARKSDYAGALDHLRNCLTYIQPGPNADLLKQQITQLLQRATATK
jgi:Tfp pilus assembly protein PilF